MKIIAAFEPDEMATILAALRYYQEKGQGDPANRSDDIHEIATCGDEVISLDATAIDDLCERLNTSPPRGALLSLIDAGLTFAQALPVFAEHQRVTEPDLAAYVEAADSLKIVRDGVLEVDGDVIVSKGNGGAYVSAWLYVENQAAGITTAQEEEESDDEEG